MERSFEPPAWFEQVEPERGGRQVLIIQFFVYDFIMGAAMAQSPALAVGAAHQPKDARSSPLVRPAATPRVLLTER